MINSEIRDQIHKLIDKASDTQLDAVLQVLNLYLSTINIQKETLILFMNAYKCLNTAAAIDIQLRIPCNDLQQTQHYQCNLK